MPFYQRGDANIYYEEYGAGAPILLLAPGAMQSSIDAWQRAAINPISLYSGEFRLIAMDQRNAGRSAGPLDTQDPWTMFAQDQLGLMDHLGIERFLAFGCCIGCSYILQLARLAPQRIIAGVMEQPIGIDPDGSNLQLFRERIWRGWGDDLSSNRPDITREDLEAFGQKMWGGDFVLNTDEEFVRNVQTPLLVLPGVDEAHPHAIGMAVANLAPNSELIEFWKSDDKLPGAIEAVRRYFQLHAEKS